MKKVYALLILFLLSYTSYAAKNETTIQASDRYITKSFEISSINQIAASGIIKIIYYQTSDGTSSAKLYAPDNIIDYVRIDVINNKLSAYITNNLKFDNRNTEIRLEVKSPEINNIQLSGVSSVVFSTDIVTDQFNAVLNDASEFSFNNINAEKIKLAANGVSKINAKNLNTTQLDVSINDASKATLVGKAHNASYTTTDIAKIDASYLSADNVIACASSASSIDCKTKRIISEKKSGISKINITVALSDNNIYKIEREPTPIVQDDDYF